jgi:phosphoribosylformylglycinamidine synthase
VAACHDCSEGGLAVTLSEMAFSGSLGMEINLGKSTLRDEAMLFSESNTRFVVEVRDEKRFTNSMKGLPICKLGNIRSGRSFKIFNGNKKLLVKTTIDKLKAAWQAPFKSL